MEQNSLAHARYWRNSLADAELGSGRLASKEAERFLCLQKEELTTGRVSNTVVEECFRDEAERVRTVEVVIRLKVYRPTVEHGKQRRSGVPDIVTPIVTRALLARDGRLYPSSPTVVPRDILEPLERGSFVIGTVSAQDEFLTKNVMPNVVYSEENQSAESDFDHQWSSFLAACERLLEHVGQGWPTAEDRFEVVDYGYLIKERSIKGTRQHIIPLYDHIRDNAPSAPLFDRYASLSGSDIKPCLPANAGFSARLGHPGNDFPLAQAQHDALAHLLVAEVGETLAVNGPPGTGKTTLLLSVVASLWAKAALEGVEPPVILAASTNNQAVTNIIDAFGKDFSKGTGPFAGRWLPEIKSFGAYFPSLTIEDENAGKYQNREFFKTVESAEYVARAQHDYLLAAARAFPEIASEDLTVSITVTALGQAIRKEAERLNAIESVWPVLTAAREAVRAELGDDPVISLADRNQQLAMLESQMRETKKLAAEWENYLADESILYSLFSWLPSIAKKRLRLARLFLKSAWPAQCQKQEWQSIEQIETTVKATIDQLERAVKEQKVRVQRGEHVLQIEQERLTNWRLAVTPLGVSAETAEHLSLAECDALADTRIRFPIFLLTTHYWEGRWLCDIEKVLPNIDGEKTKSREASEKRWRRRMKLTPCVVSTFFMLPKEMISSRHTGKGHHFTLTISTTSLTS